MLQASKNQRIWLVARGHCAVGGGIWSAVFPGKLPGGRAAAVEWAWVDGQWQGYCS